MARTGKQELKPCPCNCGELTPGGRYLHGHKPKDGAVGPANGYLLVEAHDELCDMVWKKLALRQKIAALNSLKK